MPTVTLPNSNTAMATSVSTANAVNTLTLTAPGAGLFHYIHSIQITRVSTSAITGNAVLTYTTTNIPGNPAFTAGNLAAAGAVYQDVWVDSVTRPIKTTTANTATTIVAPAVGTNGITRINVVYSIGP